MYNLLIVLVAGTPYTMFVLLNYSSYLQTTGYPLSIFQPLKVNRQISTPDITVHIHNLSFLQIVAKQQIIQDWCFNNLNLEGSPCHFTGRTGDNAGEHSTIFFFRNVGECQDAIYVDGRGVTFLFKVSFVPRMEWIRVYRLAFEFPVDFTVTMFRM